MIKSSGHHLTVGTLNQCSTIGDGDELCLALNRLVQYLGHSNALLCNIAFDEVCLYQTVRGKLT